ncbi:MAG TPA: VWA containing CoxE family protein, partial [Candidatus Polarisedimenticolia bacterium]|nr:VWA containing CoxE family protein [Candidatus Polarisedimenticolia bacterium]
MLETIHRFIAALRRSGVAIAPSEAIDAARAVRAVGVERREEVRAALRTTLAKTRPEAAVFDRQFDAFFAPPRPPRGEGKGRRRTGG